ncbi:MAG: hypothetical protein K2K77_09595 [Duncaniella sp.]|nr:hypothetical protein [Duncaniella sp.]
MNRLTAIIVIIAAALWIKMPLMAAEPADKETTAVSTSSAALPLVPETIDSVVTVTTTTVVTKVFRNHTQQQSVTTAPDSTRVQSVKADTVPQTQPVTPPVPEEPKQVMTQVAEGPKPVAPTEAVIPVVEPVPSPYIYVDTVNGRPVNDHGKIVLATIDPRLLDERVVVAGDTVPIILPAPNYGRYDRGLFNFLFIPKGQWMFGLTASYGEFNSDDVQILSLIKDLSFKGKIYSIQPTISYFFRSNQSMGLKLNYSRGIADLGGLSFDFDEDMSFKLSDISYYSETYTASVFYRNYVGLGADKRFAIFNEVDLAFGSGSSRFKRSYDGEVKDTKTLTSKWSLNFSPGLTMFIMDNVSFNVSFGVFGLHVTHDKQFTNGEDEGSRTSSGANFRFNLFNINFGLGVTI